MIIKTAERIQELRNENNMSQAQLAKKLGISRNAVNLWEMSLTYPSLNYLMELSKIFRVSTDYILGIENSKTLNVSNLDKEQLEIINKMISYFNKTKKIMTIVKLLPLSVIFNLLYSISNHKPHLQVSRIK